MSTTAQQLSRVLIVDDHPLLREALSLLISSVPDLRVCGETSHEYEALVLADQLSPDLVLVDVSLETGNGLELVKQLKQRHPQMKSLVISAYPESLYAERALRAGALGYINKQEAKETLVEAIRTVLKDGRYISPEVTRRLVGQALGGQKPHVAAIETLSDRELEVFQCIGRALTGAAIAEKLGVSVHTVDTYRARLKTKFGLASGAELQREAVRWVLENE